MGDAGSPDELVADFLARWLADNVAPTRRPGTLRSYSYVVRQHITPHLGAMTVGSVQPRHVQHLVAGLTAGGSLSPASVRLVLRVLRVAFNLAERWGMVATSPARYVEPPRQGPRRGNPMSKDEARRFIEAAKGERLEALFVLAVTVGMRRGELLGLPWANVDLGAGTVAVLQQVTHTADGWRPAPLKTHASRRTINIPPIAVEALRRHKVAQETEALRLGLWLWDTGGLGLVFPGPRGDPGLECTLHKSYRRVLKRAGVPVRRFHDTRHTAASLMMQAGVNPRVVMATLGHSSIQQTLDVYTHVNLEAQASAAQAMQGMLG